MDLSGQQTGPNWQDLKLFLAVAESGSFSAAARLLGLGQPTLSRRIAEFESDLGTSLFVRLPQGCQLTETGRALLPAAQQMACWAQQAKLALTPTPHQVKGKVRVTAPPGIAFTIVPTVAKQVRERFPDIQLEVISSVDTLDLARGEADISLRTQLPSSNELLCLASLRSEMAAYAHPEYIKTLVARPELADIDWICWAPPFEQLQVNQVLQSQIDHFTPCFSSDDFNVQLAACAAGVGAMVLPLAICDHPLLQALRPLPLDISQYGIGELYLVVHRRQAHLPKIKQVANAVADHFAAVTAQL
ncbi:LysR family transcriptional regulator [Motilimonas eburnea]|uniref:LysR family transcriptional regulator n=1 Tax=Motilimonas eburnea TaxID=1737488 RepID=UPI001E2E9385|nr:LysR family transcriptional regulator [Motilimonas eburnea]MCE2572946.1 LysR family transcriptional regulator [Motilimonas eburnea]